MVTYGIIAAMPAEAALLIENMEQAAVVRIGGMEYTHGTLCGQSVVVAVCGIGKVFAAMCAQTMILQFAPQYIINTGVAGAIGDNLQVGDLVIAKQAVQHDMDTSPIGDPVGMLSGINVTFLPADTALCARIAAAAEDLGITPHIGTVATGDQFVADDVKKQYIRQTFGASCCEMEGGAIAQVCYVNGVPFAVVRAMSDSAAGDATMEYPAFAAMAAARSANLICKVLEKA